MPERHQQPVFHIQVASARVACGVGCGGARLPFPASRPVATLVESNGCRSQTDLIILSVETISWGTSILSGGGSCWGSFGASNRPNSMITYGVDAEAAITDLEGTVAKDHGQAVTDRPIGVLSTGL
jgi:hypothetical protein